MRTRIVTHHLEMTDAGALRPPAEGPAEVELRRAEVACPELNRFLYAAVGGDWYWVDRLDWTYRRWMDYLARPEIETWVAYVSGTPSGYFELEMQAGSNVEIAYLGLLPQFVGQRLGGGLLTAAIRRAWEMGAARVWVHTCSLDHPAALQNYLARGFRVFKEEISFKDLPESPP